MILQHNKKNYFKQKTDGQALKQLGCFQTGPLVQFFDQKMIPQGWPSKLFSMWRAKKLCSFFTERKKKIRMKRNETSLTHKNKNYLFESEKKYEQRKKRNKKKSLPIFEKDCYSYFTYRSPNVNSPFHNLKLRLSPKFEICCIKMCENSIFTFWNWKKNQSKLELFNQDWNFTISD